MAEISSISVEAARLNCNIDWRTQKSCFDEQTAHFCIGEEMAGVEFVFDRGGEMIVCCFICYFIDLTIRTFRVFQPTLSCFLCLGSVSEKLGSVSESFLCLGSVSERANLQNTQSNTEVRSETCKGCESGFYV